MTFFRLIIITSPISHVKVSKVSKHTFTVISTSCFFCRCFWRSCSSCKKPYSSSCTASCHVKNKTIVSTSSKFQKSSRIFRTWSFKPRSCQRCTSYWKYWSYHAQNHEGIGLGPGEPAVIESCREWEGSIQEMLRCCPPSLWTSGSRPSKGRKTIWSMGKAGLFWIFPSVLGTDGPNKRHLRLDSTCCHLDILSKDAKALVYWRGVASIKAEWSWWCEEHTWCTFQIRLCPGSEEIFTKRRKITTCKGNNCWSPACFSSISMATCWVYWKVQPVCHWHSAAAANSQLDKLSQAPAPAWAAESAQFIWFFFALYEARPQIWIISIAFCLVEIEMVRVGSSQSFHLTSLQKCWWKIHPPVLEWIM